MTFFLLRRLLPLLLFLTLCVYFYPNKTPPARKLFFNPDTTHHFDFSFRTKWNEAPFSSPPQAGEVFWEGHFTAKATDMPNGSILRFTIEELRQKNAEGHYIYGWNEAPAALKTVAFTLFVTHEGKIQELEIAKRYLRSLYDSLEGIYLRPLLKSFMQNPSTLPALFAKNNSSMQAWESTGSFFVPIVVKHRAKQNDSMSKIHSQTFTQGAVESHPFLQHYKIDQIHHDWTFDWTYNEEKQSLSGLHAKGKSVFWGSLFSNPHSLEYDFTLALQISEQSQGYVLSPSEILQPYYPQIHLKPALRQKPRA